MTSYIFIFLYLCDLYSQYLAAVQLEQLKLPGSDPEVLPQVLLEVCAALSVKTEPIKTLVSSMKGKWSCM